MSVYLTYVKYNIQDSNNVNAHMYMLQMPTYVHVSSTHIANLWVKQRC